MVVTKILDLIPCDCRDFRSESFHGLARLREGPDEACLGHTTARLGDDVTQLTPSVRDHTELPLVEAADCVAAFEPTTLVIDYDRVISEAIQHRLDVMRVEALDICPQHSFLVAHRVSKVRVLDGPPSLTGASRPSEAPADFQSAV
jgi:hypothetical protein